MEQMPAEDMVETLVSLVTAIALAFSLSLYIYYFPVTFFLEKEAKSPKARKKKVK